MRIGTVLGATGHAEVALEIDDQWYTVRTLVRRLGVPAGYPPNLEQMSLLQWIEGGLLRGEVWAWARRGLRDRAAAEECALTAPHFLLPYRPGQIIAAARNFSEHVRELGHALPQEPHFFTKSPYICIGPGEPIRIPSGIGEVHYEGELAFVVGKVARSVTPERAHEYIAAYTILNDVTARTLQRRDIEGRHPWFRSKNMDTFCPLGPALTPAEVLPFPPSLRIRTWVNDHVRQDGHTDQFIFGISDLLSRLTRHLTLFPGDVVATGTPAGVGPLQPGDRVRIEITPHVGALENPVVAEEDT